MLRGTASLLPLVALLACGPAGDPRPVVLDLVERFPLAELDAEAGRIDLGSPDARRMLGRGWSVDEAREDGLSYVWGIGLESQIHFFLAEPRSIPLRFRAAPHEPPGAGHQTLRLRLNGRRVSEIPLVPGWSQYRLQVPDHFVRAGENVLSFGYEFARAPADYGSSHDSRALAVAWDWVALGDEPGRGVSLPAVDAKARRLEIPAGSRVCYDAHLPERAELRASQAGGGVGLHLHVIGLQGRELLDRALSASRLREGVAISGERSEPVKICLQPASSGPGSEGRLSLTRPVLRGSRPEGASTGTGARPNIVVYLVDTLRPDHLTVYGYGRPTSPALEDFSRDALVFDDALAHTSWTRPATASVFTGLPARQHGVNGRTSVLPRQAVTLAERLRGAGYRTAAFVQNAHITRDFGFDQGFSRFADITNLGGRAPDSGAAPREEPSASEADVLHASALSWLEERNPTEPFFLYVHSLDPHTPYSPLPSMLERIAGDQSAPSELRDPDTIRELQAEETSVSDETRADLLRLYDAEVATNDFYFGLLIDALRSAGVYEEALVVFLSDHGEGFFEHSLFGHGRTLYGEVLRIPLLVKLPASSGIAPRRVAAPVEQIDVAPTLLDFVGLSALGMDGRSLLPLSEQGGEASTGRRYAYLHYGTPEMDSVVEGRWKLIRTGLEGPGPPDSELYDLETDPGEQRDLAEARPEIRQRLTRLLRARARRPAALDPVQTRLDPTLEERLRALGYAE